ncbi:MAG: 1-deoxy-D-xylulose-5-phosphate synthase [bacterium]|jgi:1-deoxy-D-xylulose-5-phosphate synthase|nr:1-deoxy-D-xylulose-5-phosphate synthase [bacterium]MDD3805453.1 1-deoxy-D-xylulose-5-phosphate synthase [bacterium]
MKECILNNIIGPGDIKSLNARERETLCREIRERLVEVVSCNGGHLASNLGVVELTVALHTVFNTPQDSIIWDVGHQSYVHKLLTGRNKAFPTIRREGGLSGFPRPDESEHDAFIAGHGSTSISAALGIAASRRITGNTGRVVAVIGDGALTGGMAYEALNQAGHLGCDLVIVLNDNDMSISENVGAMSRYLSRIRLDPAYQRIKDEFEHVMSLTAMGSAVLRLSERFKDRLKRLMVPGVLFEELNITYIGPLDGHNLDELIPAMERACAVKGPVMLHTVTLKGRGYTPAEENATKFHGAKPFVIETGEFAGKSARPTFTSVFGNTLTDIAYERKDLIAITAAMTDGTGLERFAKEHEKRFFDVGMAEEHAVTFAAGCAASGLKPVLAIYSTFLQRAYDQIFHDICLQKLPVIFALDRAGLVGEDGPTHQGIFDLSYLRHLPGMTVMAPRDEAELTAMLYTALDISGPVAIRYPRAEGEGISFDADYPQLELGRAELLKPGVGILLLGVGPCIWEAMRAAHRLEHEGIDVAVMDARFAKPLDSDAIINALADCHTVITLEENILQGGFGSAVAELLADKGIDKQLIRLGLPDTVPMHASRFRLLSAFNLDAEGIYTTVKETIARCVQTFLG